MAPDLNLRPFRAADLPAMQSVRQAAFEPVFQSFRDIVGEEVSVLALAGADREQAALLDTLCTPEAADRMFVATVGDEIVGFVCFSVDLDKRTGEIGLNGVHPDHTGHGIGAEMYRFVLARMKETGMVLATVGTGGDPSHAPARRAYEKVGFDRALPSVYLYKVL